MFSLATINSSVLQMFRQFYFFTTGTFRMSNNDNNEKTRYLRKEQSDKKERQMANKK